MGGEILPTTQRRVFKDLRNSEDEREILPTMQRAVFKDLRNSEDEQTSLLAELQIEIDRVRLLSLTGQCSNLILFSKLLLLN